MRHKRWRSGFECFGGLKWDQTGDAIRKSVLRFLRKVRNSVKGLVENGVSSRVERITWGNAD